MSEDHLTVVAERSAEAERIHRRLVQVKEELGVVRDELARSRGYLIKAAYYHERGEGCPRCGKPMDGYEDGSHPCLAIERENESALAREIFELQVELAHLRTIEAEIESGVVYVQALLPTEVLGEFPKRLTEAQLQQKQIAARRALLGMR